MIIPRDIDDAWVCAVALWAGLTVEVEGLFRLVMRDGRHCYVERLEGAVYRSLVSMSKAELDYKMRDVKFIVDGVLVAMRELYGPRPA